MAPSEFFWDPVCRKREEDGFALGQLLGQAAELAGQLSVVREVFHPHATGIWGTPAGTAEHHHKTHQVPRNEECQPLGGDSRRHRAAGAAAPFLPRSTPDREVPVGAEPVRPVAAPEAAGAPAIIPAKMAG